MRIKSLTIYCSSSKNLEIARTSFLNKSNSTFIEQMYMKFIENDPDLPLSWENYFRSLGEDLNSVAKEIEGPNWKPNKKKIKIKLNKFVADVSNCPSIAANKSIFSSTVPSGLKSNVCLFSQSQKDS